MTTTIKLSKETKKKLDALDFAGKNKSYDMVVTDLLVYYNTRKKKYDKDYSAWEKQNAEHKKNLEIWKKQNKEYVKNQKKYEKEREQWQRLLKWAKKQGFKE